MVAAMLAAVVLAGYPADVPVAEDEHLEEPRTPPPSVHLAEEPLELSFGSFLLASAAVAGIDVVGTTAMGVGGTIGIIGLVITVGGLFSSSNPNPWLGVPLMVGGGAVFLAGGLFTLLGPPLASGLLLSSGEGTFMERVNRALPGMVAALGVHLLAGACAWFAAEPGMGLGLYAAAAGLELVGQPLAAWATNRSAAPQVTVLQAEF